MKPNFRSQYIHVWPVMWFQSSQFPADVTILSISKHYSHSVMVEKTVNMVNIGEVGKYTMLVGGGSMAKIYYG